MIAVVHPGGVRGAMVAPPSKSHAIRLLLAAALARGESRLSGVGASDDVRAARGLVHALGASVHDEGDDLVVRGDPDRRPRGGVVTCGESGLLLRAAGPLLATGQGRWRMEAEGSLRARTVPGLEAALQTLGGRASTHGGHPPIEVEGPLSGGVLDFDAGESSQVLTGLLLAAPLIPEGLTLRLTGLASRPWVELTISVLAARGVRVEADLDAGCIHVPGGQALLPGPARVEGDWSGAAFLLVAGALCGDVTVRGLDPDSPQADRALLPILASAGAAVQSRGRTVRATAAPLRAFFADVRDCPDLAPPLAALATGCQGTSRLQGVGRLRGKESDRAAALVAELSRLGIAAGVEGDEIQITGGQPRGGLADAHADHRIAMALAVLALHAAGPVTIQGAGSVAKSFPAFFEELTGLQRGCA